jgi:hypothetical protein
MWVGEANVARMKPRRIASIGVFILVFGLLVTTPRAADTIPAQIPDAEFWKMIGDFSERDGDFSVMSIITSNEVDYQTVIPELRKTVKPGGVYIGVGPEQNFTYMAAMRSKIGFVLDIRRDNMLEHLMYKALFEISKDRVDFISHLFARRPAGTIPNSTARAIMAAFAKSKVDTMLYRDTLRAIEAQLQTAHRFPISSSDLKRIEYLYNTFSMQGVLSFSSSLSFKSPGYTYLMTTDDRNGTNWSFLASDANFQFIQELQRKNLIIPLVGDFAGSKSIRAIGQYLKDHGSTAALFYLSNVEYYISPPRAAQKTWEAYCRNIASLPADANSMVIRFDPYNMTRHPEQTIGSLPELIQAIQTNTIPDYVRTLNMAR